MKIVVIGDGKVGRAIIEQTCKEGHVVVVIDQNPDVIESVINKYDVMGVLGNGASYITQKNAGVGTASLVVAATSSDETNILSCLVAKRLGAKYTIARVRDYDYSKQTSLIQKDLGINMVINPELESANEIMKIINFPQAIRVDSFAKGKVDIVEVFVPENNALCGLSLLDIRRKYQLDVLICTVRRGDEVIIPTGNFVIKSRDRISLTANKSNIRLFLKKLDLIEEKIKKVMIIGGGKIALYLGNLLLNNNYDVKIIENSLDRCKVLSQLLSRAEIINGDGTNQEILLSEGLKTTDAVVCLTGNDEENIIISMYANTEHVGKIITKVSKSNFASILEAIGGVSVIKPSGLTAAQVISFVRAKNNIRGNNLKTLYKLNNNEVEALEFNVIESSKIINKPLKDLRLKKGILISCIIRDDDIIIPSGSDIIEPGDSVIIVTPASQMLVDLDDICL